jgi:integrase
MEACAIDTDDIVFLDEGTAIVRIRKPKGYERGVMPREVGLDVRATEMIKEWMAVRGGGAGPVFTTKTGSRVLPSYVRQVLPRLAKRAGITRRVHPHALRHTFARELYDEGVGMVEIMRALGHQSLSTTQKYLESIGATEVVATTTNRRWHGEKNTAQA